MGSLLSREPAVVISGITGFILQLFALIAIFGLNLPEDIRTTILAVVEPLVVLFFLVGGVIRANVFAPDTVERIEQRQEMRAWMGDQPVPTHQPTSPDPSLLR